MVGISLWLGAGELCGIVPRLSSCQPVSRLLRITVLWLAGFVLGFGPLYAWNLNRHVTRVLSSADGGNVELRARDFQLLPYAKQSVGAVRRIFAQARIDAKTDGQLLVATTRRVDVPPDTQIEGTIDGDDVYFTHSVRIAGNVISSWSPDSDFQMSLPAREFPILLVNGLQAVEDRDFARHPGIDFSAMVRAAWVNLRAREIRQGASTLTQQWVKNRFLTQTRSWSRKLNEVALALFLEQRLTKAQILESYLNDANLGQRGGQAVLGFAAASRHYFDEPLDALRPSQIALLIAVLRGPSWYNPWRNPERALTRRNQVLDQFYATGLISRTILGKEKSSPLGIQSGHDGGQRTAPAFVDLVRRQLGAPDDPTLVVVSTLDESLQEQLETAAQTARRRLGGSIQLAAVVVERDSGDIVATVGGLPVHYAGFNRVVDARRPVGSVIKPFIYLAALLQPDFTLASTVEDSPFSVPIPGQPPWQPRNGDGRSLGTLSLIEALSLSRNQATVRLGYRLGLGTINTVLADLGWQGRPLAHPADLIGAVEMSPLEVAQLYLSLSRHGSKLAVSSIQRTVGETVRQPPAIPKSEGYPVESFLIAHALQRAVDEGTGRSIADAIGVEYLAGKTGTTNGNRDSWFAGFTERWIIVVWLGMDDNQPTRLTGAGGAGSVVADFFSHSELTPFKPAVPEGVAFTWIHSGTGTRTSARCRNVDFIPMREDRLPRKTDKCPD